GIENDGRKFRLIGRIGKMLRLNAEAAAMTKALPPCTETAIEEIAGIKLRARLGGQYFQHTTSGVLFNSRRKTQLARRCLVQHKIVVVAPAQLQLLILCTYVLADSLGFTEIER